MQEAANRPLNIVVLVKHVPDAQFDRHLTGPGHTLDRSESILSELDEYALEAALQLAEARGGEAAGNRVTALSMGPAAAVNAVKKSLQIGAYSGVHLSDEALAGSDAAGTSLALAAAVRAIADADGPVDLVISGMASTDGETSLVPAQLAERLQLAQVTFASELEVADSADGPLVKARRDGDSFTETVEAPLPALVSVTDQANDPRYPNFKGIMAAKKKTVRVLSLADLGIEAGQVGRDGAWTTVAASAPRPPRSQGTIITDDGSAGVQLVDYLAAQKLI
ncbi:MULTISPECIES: electron transfer flavoprotein subunit beta/FixA family protein [unclassified Arthrobacter]|uniref:electron transfer flavoprotein subunit beta/FixA family protein n=1 Tax=unclassified Arthrobacter TaxID=235627 RepID=UPI001D15547F|nr:MULTISPECIES: electron transfer flavoprotein subunit beta/FixA family protein [unclassified Arthrobacter]MCC3276808.1 electron transfer flavoprotein subunit beta/FixA family protein [Arthrobacter sp. zg-Y20]MCC3277761.1 electron transfer flavoprotein subunit beta/FixA family protein [Arthrobacter sp. zg-Y40]MCC9176165.1 electron transfer flavoprotein subunit beta/FixA family protein [Arthrobacter sp. zg-Y750]MDK1316968.1 electron transfer flavoprotein subunit beta/FixA family protein [Arthro